MIIISHRGNLHGPLSVDENSPKAINDALSRGFDVEIDIRVINDKIYLGHDEPTYETDIKFLQNPHLWIHCKNMEALQLMTQTENVHYFWHENDKYIFTSCNIIWTYVDTPLLDNSICVLPEIGTYDYKKCLGICTDFPIKYADR